MAPSVCSQSSQNVFPLRSYVCKLLSHKMSDTSQRRTRHKMSRKVSECSSNIQACQACADSSPFGVGTSFISEELTKFKCCLRYVVSDARMMMD